MAGDWIKMRVDLLTSPKVVRMASALNADRFRIIGGLLSAWSLFDAHSVDGRLEGYTPKAVDEVIGWNGFSSAMISVSWMILEGDTVLLPEFDTHNGAPAKRRAQEAERKRRERSGAVKEFKAAVDALGDATNVPDLSAPVAAENQTRVEESRVENKTSISTELKQEITKEKKPAPRAKRQKSIFSELDFSSWPNLPSEKIMNAWIELRAKKRAHISQIVVEAFGRELTKAGRFGFTVDQCLLRACEKGWRGFEADWMQSQGEYLPKQNFAQSENAAGKSNSTRDIKIVDQLNNRDWAEG